VTGVFQPPAPTTPRRPSRRGRRGFPAWAALRRAARARSSSEAADALEARDERIAQDMTAEMGKPLREARMEAARARRDPPLRRRRGVAPDRRGLRRVRADQRLYTVRRPLGVVG
jgi:acyl-CoA reductase-like NAD-dependent aldehyde dehydrogenase